jgi:hypothetical protein
VGAQGGIPATAGPEAANPAECAIEPRPVDDMLAVVRTVYASPDAPPRGNRPVTVEPGPNGPDVTVSGVPWVLDGTVLRSPPAPPAGTPADPATASAVAATVRELTACENAGDIRRLLSLLTDGGLADTIDENRRPEGEEAPIPEEGWPTVLSLAPQPQPARYWGVAPEVLEVRLLADGWAGAVVSNRSAAAGGGDPSRSEGREQFFVLARVEGRWLIDEVVENLTLAPANSPPATPAS